MTTENFTLTGDRTEAISCLREALRSMHQGMAMLFYVPEHQGEAVREYLDQAEGLMLQAQDRLRKAIAKIGKTQSKPAAQPAA